MYYLKLIIEQLFIAAVLIAIIASVFGIGSQAQSLNIREEVEWVKDARENSEKFCEMAGVYYILMRAEEYQAVCNDGTSKTFRESK